MINFENNIEAKDKPLGQIFERQHFVIDSYQRAYRWQRKQIETLLDDLYYSFVNNFSYPNRGNDVKLFSSYFMGPIVLSQTKTEKSIVDGQQRLTTFTLLLIFLYKLCAKLNISCDISLTNYIYYNRNGNKTFVLNIPERQRIMNLLLADSPETLLEVQESGLDESEQNMINAYQQILEDFPVDLRAAEILPTFIEWLLDNVILVEITAFSSENAYTIFETMNNRGLTLTPTEILKAHILSQISDEEKASELNYLWHKKINSIVLQAGDNSDSDFFKAWFRAKYAQTIRSNSSNKEKEDFESIGAQYHTWFKNNNKKCNLRSSQDYYFFVKGDFDFFADLYINIKQSQWNEDNNGLHAVYVTSCYPMADSLYLPLLLSPLMLQDNEKDIEKKILLLNSYVDTLNNIRTLSNLPITQIALRNSINNLILSIRNCSLETLYKILNTEKEKLLSNYVISIDTFAPGSYYAHYFLARMRFFYLKNIQFSSLLRTKRQNSFITVPVVKYEEMEELNAQSKISIIYHSLVNTCLIKRNQQNEYYQKNITERLQWLFVEGYLPEMSNEPFNQLDVASILICRQRKIEDFIRQTWLSDFEYIS